MANLRVDKITSTETFETTGSVQFDGSGDYLDVTESNNGFDFDGDFTIETWIHINTIPSNSWVDFLGSANNSAYLGSSKSGWIAAYYTLNVTGLQFRLSYQSNSGWIFELGWDYTADTGNWYHVAYTRKDSVIDCYVNGVKLEKSSRSGTGGEEVTVTSSEGFVRIGGGHGSTAKLLDGHLSNTRILKGKAIYTKNFKPPMRELEVTPETTLLCCQSKTDTILEKTGKTTAANGNAVANELTPGLLTPVVKSGGGSAITGSVEFTGSPSKLTADSVDFAMGSNDLTMECWFYNGVDTITHLLQIDTGTYQSPSDITNFSLATRDAAAGDVRFLVRNDSGSNLSDLITGAPGAKINAWHHLAGTIEGTTTRLFLNGILIASGTISGTRTHTGQRLTIGANQTSRYLKGYISNARVVRGTALYTDDFTPPTRELKRVPGTVLLCCQDSNNPTTEATGKTITGYGDLNQVYNTQLVTNGTFDSDASGWTALNSTLSVSSGQLTITNNGATNGRATSTAFNTIIGARYVLKYNTITSGGSYQIEIRESNGGGAEQAWASSTDGASEVRYFQATHNQHTVVIYSIGADGVATKYDNVYVSKVNPGKTGSNFTPQVGDDRQITFEGVTKINTDAYFYLPTGDTASREATGTYNAGTRGIFGGGLVPSDSREEIQYINIATTGDALDFGNLTQERWGNGACASDTRALWGAGLSTGPSAYWNIIDYVTIMSTGNALDFGDLTYGVPYYTGAVSNTIRGIWGGGYNTPSSPQVPSPFPSGFQNEMEYVIIASKGNGIDFGDFTARNSVSTFGSPTRGIFAAGATPTRINTMEYITIASSGNAQDFGDLLNKINYGGGCSNSIRGIVFGGYDGAASANTNVISYTTIASTGNAQDFGDLTTAKSELGACSSSTRGVVGGGWSPVKIDEMDYVTIATTGNALAFGELANVGVYQECGTSNGHGGLG